MIVKALVHTRGDTAFVALASQRLLAVSDLGVKLLRDQIGIHQHCIPGAHGDPGARHGVGTDALHCFFTIASTDPSAVERTSVDDFVRIRLEEDCQLGYRWLPLFWTVHERLRLEHHITEVSDHEQRGFIVERSPVLVKRGNGKGRMLERVTEGVDMMVISFIYFVMYIFK